MSLINYQIFVPGGNKTALVFGGLEYDAAKRKEIQDKILSRHENDSGGEVEQVGFVSPDKKAPRLIMAGGEFCGNATRAAAAYYLEVKAGEIEINVSGAIRPLRAGICAHGEVWAQMPVQPDINAAVRPLPSGEYWVMIDGISHLVVPQRISEPILNRVHSCADNAEKLSIALDFLEKTIAKNALPIGDAYGLMLLENTIDILAMHPFVHVKTSGTTYYETGCGSGAICVGLVSSLLRGGNIKLPLLQPSGKIITAEAGKDAAGNAWGKISGGVEVGGVFEMDGEL